MSRSAIKIRDVRSSARKELSIKPHRSASLDTRAARGSYCPEKSRPSSEERKSGNKLLGVNNRWGNPRKSSITLSDAKRKDTRPLTDKAYQKRKVTELFEFLEETGFGLPLSVSKLMSPSRKDFENIFQFMYKYFDPNYEVKRIEEEGPKLLKNLGYPFTINKSAFLYVARTNWPSLLGALIWLMDMIKFGMKVDISNITKVNHENEDGGERAQVYRIVLRYICQSHHSGTDNEEEEIAIFTQIIQSSEPYDLDRLRAENEEKKLNLESINKEVEDLKILNEHKITLESTIKKFEDYITKMRPHYQKKKEQCEQLAEELKQKEVVFKAFELEVAKKQELYDAQGFDGKKHLNYFEIQKKELNETLEKKRAVINKLQDKLWESEIEYKKNSDKVIAGAESFRSMYNNIVDQSKTLLQPLHDIKTPHVQKLCSSFYFEFPDWNISLHKYDEEFRKAHRNVLKNIVERIKGTDEILNRIHDAQKQQMDEIEMKRLELSAQLKVLSVHGNQKERDLSSKIKQTEEEISALETQCKTINENVKAFQTEKLELEKTYKKMCEEFNTLQLFKDRKEKELTEFLSEQMEMFMFFEEAEKEAVKLCEDYGKEISENLEEMNKLMKN